MDYIESVCFFFGFASLQKHVIDERNERKKTHGINNGIEMNMIKMKEVKIKVSHRRTVNHSESGKWPKLMSVLIVGKSENQLVCCCNAVIFIQKMKMKSFDGLDLCRNFPSS